MTSDVAEAAVAFVEAGYFGFVWVDGDLVARGGAGQLSAMIPPGRAICEAVPVLFGLEQRIRALQSGPESALEIPNVATVGPDGEDHRMNYVVTWHPRRSQFLVLAARPIAIDETTIELQREARRRRVAEEQVLEQAEAIHEANVALTRANAELGEFTRIVSHDLKAPMRAMRYFAEDLEASLPQGSSSDARAHLARLKAQSRRMSAMITGLLEYCRLDREIDRDEGEELVDTSALVEEVVASLPVPDGFTINVEPDLPELRTLRPLLDLIVRNLLENAMKHHDSCAASITVSGVRRADGGARLTIADDGPGIPPDLQAAAFNPFTRLSGPRAAAAAGDREDGIGMGLALVKRAAEALGAELVLESDPATSRGTRFHVDWPRPTKAK